MLTDAALQAFVHSTDLDRSAAFYAGVLGLTVRDQNPGAVVLDAGGTTVRITLVPGMQAAPATVLGWEVADIAAAAAWLSGEGVALTRYDGMDQDDLGVWTSPDGSRVAWFRDPDGNVLSVSQPA